MADTKIQITQGSGTNIDAQQPGGTGNLRQTITIGDALATLGIAPVDATLGVYVAANQITTPWLVTGSVGVTQLGAPWIANVSIQGMPSVNATLAAVVTVSTGHPNTSGGTTTFSLNSLLNSPTNVKTSPGQVYAYHLFNPNSVPAYIEVFNGLASSVSLANATIPYDCWALPSSGGAIRSLDWGQPFNNSISIAASATYGALVTLSSPVNISIQYM